jgi:hypothetical protein
MDMTFTPSQIAELVFGQENSHAPQEDTQSLRITLCDRAADGRECFLTCLDVLLNGLLRVFGGDPQQASPSQSPSVNISDIDEADFESCITKRMRAMLDVYPILVAVPSSIGVGGGGAPSEYVAPLDSATNNGSTTFREGGRLEDYGATFCIRGRWLMLRFKSVVV